MKHCKDIAGSDMLHLLYKPESLMMGYEDIGGWRANRYHVLCVFPS